MALAVMIALAVPTPALALVEITHDGVDCVIARSFPVIQARLRPPAEVARARVYFHARRTPYWYYVDMRTTGNEAFEGILPQPLESLEAVEYYIETLDHGFAQGRSAEYSARVITQPGSCSTGMTTATTVSSPPSMLLIGAPQGAPAVPPGFSGIRVVASVGAGGAPGATAAGGATGAAGASAATTGGISAGVLLGIAAAGGAAVAVAAGRGGGDEAAAADTPAPSPGGTPQPQPTPTPGSNASGRWVGSFIENPSTVLCSVTTDLGLDLQQSGAAVSGTFQLLIRSATRAPQGPCSVQAGEAFAGPASGSVTDSNITLQLRIPANPPQEFRLQGTISGNRMGGISPPDAEGPGGSWEVTRQ
jgi:hypothetical protein